MDNFWLIALVLISGLVVRHFVVRSTNKKRDAKFEVSLKKEFNTSDLNEAVTKALQPAKAALTSKQYTKSTREYALAEALLHTLAYQSRDESMSTRGSDLLFNIRVKYALRRGIERLGLFKVKNPIDTLHLPMKHWDNPSFLNQMEHSEKTDVEREHLKFGATWVRVGIQLYDLSPKTKVEVASSGQKHVNYTSRASLGSAMAGVVLPGPAMIYALARPKVVRHDDDLRELTIAIWDKGWEIEVALDPDDKRLAKQFAIGLEKQIAKLGGGTTTKVKTTSAKPETPSTAGNKSSSTNELAKLVKLYEKGLITEDEFKDLKAGL